MSKILSQRINIGGQNIEGPLEGPGGKSINTLADVVNILIQFLVPLAALILFIMLLWGGIGFMLSAGSPEKIKSARARITTALIGFLILILAYLITKALSLIFGLGQGII